jgi:hypothetical protein
MFFIDETYTPLFMFGPKLKLVIYNCVTAQHWIVNRFPFKVGSGEGCDVQISAAGMGAVQCVFDKKFSSYTVHSPTGTPFFLNGKPNTPGEIDQNIDNSFIFAGNLFALYLSADEAIWLRGFHNSEWFIYSPGESVSYGPVAYQDLASHLDSFPEQGAGYILLRTGLNQRGFYASQVLPLLPRPTPEPMVEAPPPEEENSPHVSEVDAEYGEFTCPVCWLKFDRCDVMNIAVHASLRGDPLLGEEHMQRFYATRFNDRGQGIDPMNIPAPDIACPHCRRKLPQGFLDIAHLIFSIIGAPSSGKSYYLSVLVKTLQKSLFQNFNASFRDADPSANVILNQMKHQLFSASSPEDAFLAKTELEGAMYEILPRFGRKVALPKPFIFHISNSSDSSQDLSVVFYDNAGEHFEPTRNSADSPGAQHIASASGIFFLFDPLHNEEFKRRITGLADPQAFVRRMDQQDVILAETEVRMKNLLFLEARQRVSTPFAVILGKCDTCLELLGGSHLQSPVRDGKLDIALVRANSQRVRNLLIDLSPSIVANAEAISSDVMYFAASSLGCSPVEFTDSRGINLIAPDPQKIAPIQVEIPTLWVLSRLAPHLVPSINPE